MSQTTASSSSGFRTDAQPDDIGGGAHADLFGMVFGPSAESIGSALWGPAILSGATGPAGPLIVEKVEHRAPDFSTRALRLVDIPSTQWERPCEALFQHLASKDPLKLSEWIRSGHLPSWHLAHAAEALGEADALIATPTLMQLLCHPEPVVREGALHGLALHIEDDEVAKAIERLLQDSNSVVRKKAQSALRQR